jgi:hypothetical protein
MRTLHDQLSQLDNDQLASIYIEAIGYDPLEENATRENVINILVEYQQEDGTRDINDLIEQELEEQQRINKLARPTEY